MSRTTSSKVTGTMHEVDGRGAVRMETRFDTSAADVWDALTTPDRLARWLGDVHGDLRLGGDFQATFVSGWSGPGRVEECDPPRRLVVRQGDPGEVTVVEAVLSEEDGGVLLVVEERDLPLPDLPAYGAGWQVHLEDLGRHLAGDEQLDWEPRWRALWPDYRERPVAGVAKPGAGPSGA